MSYNYASIKANIENCKVNIKTFEDAIEKENATIRELRGIMRTLDEKEAQKSNVHIEIDNDG